MGNNTFKKLLSDTFIYGLSGIISSFVSIFLIPLYTKVFEPADYGIISIMTATSAFLNILLIFSMDNSAAVWFFDKPSTDERKVTFNTWVIFLAGCGFVLMLLLIIFSAPLSSLIFDRSSYSLLFALVGLNLLFVGFQKVVNIWCRMLQKPVQAMLYSLIVLSTTVSLNILFVLHLNFGVKGVFYSQLAASIMGFVAMLVLLRSWISPRCFSSTQLREMLRFSLPLVPATVLYWLMNMASIFFLKLLLKNNTEIGLFQVGSNVANVLSLCTWAFFQAWTPFALSVSSQKDAQKIYSKIFELYCLGGFTCALLLLFFAKDILIIFTHHNYLGAWKVIGLLAINVIVLGLPNIMVIANNIVKKNRPYAFAMSVGAICTVGFFFIFIPFFGKEGAAASMIVGNLVMCIVLGCTAQILYFIPYNFKRIALYVISFSTFIFLLLQLQINFLEKLAITFLLFLISSVYFLVRLKKFNWRLSSNG